MSRMLTFSFFMFTYLSGVSAPAMVTATIVIASSTPAAMMMIVPARTADAPYTPVAM